MTIHVSGPITPHLPLDVSLASLAAQNEKNALSISFLDGSARIKDKATPANNYNTSLVTTAASLLTYTSPSPKLTRQSDGVFRYQAHNLFLNSAAPANQSITVLSGATYAVILTGAVTTTLSGAATGTITAGTTNITAATATLTFGSTSGAGTVQVTRTPASLTFLATAGTARYNLPYEYTTSGTALGVRVEPAATNLALWSNDFTNAAWTKSNLTPAKTATGPDGVTNSASTLTATAGNATALQAITSGSAARITHCSIKRRTGTGSIDLTQDNGSTWTTVTTTAGWTQVPLASITSTNPTIGIRIVTSGDAVDVAYFQHELGSTTSSPIETFGSTVTRAADNISLATSAFPYSATEGTIVFVGSKFGAVGYSTAVCMRNTGTALADRFDMGMGTGPGGSGGSFRTDVITSSSTQASLGSSAAFVQNQSYMTALAFAANDFASATNGGGLLTDATGTVPTGINILEIGHRSAIQNLNGHIQAILYVPRRVSNADLPTFGA